MKKIIYLMILLGFCTLACSATLIKPEAQISASLPTEMVQAITAQAGIANPETCKVNAANLNVRSAPNPDADVIAWLHAGDLLTIQNDPPVNGWIHVQAGDLTGWINSIYCKRN